MDMFFSKAQRIDAGFNSRSDLPSQPVFSKIIIIDKRNPHTSDHIFSLCPDTVIDTDDLQALKASFISGFHEESFLQLGDMASIDRKKKLIKLTDGRLLSYEHLVVATNPKNWGTDENVKEFFSGLATLVDALRMKKQQDILADQNTLNQNQNTMSEKKCVKLNNGDDSMSKAVYEGQLEMASDWFFDTDVRLYEVQI